ncbi:uL13 family ribosomal protein [Candidatus Kaiserbacteria bacterium]|nr:uL13 family ribosomal protein [Candidatus Kaiserbacteria bacterium]
MKEYTIDAAGKTLGRVASEAAKALMGKTSADYTPHIRSEVRVKIVNVGKLYMRARKRSTKTYTTYSGYPSGRKVETYAALSSRRGADVPLRHAIRRMLPRNTFLKARMRQLEISL